MVRLQGVADPGDQGRGDGRGVAAGSLQSAGLEGGHLVGGVGIALEEVAPLGHEGRAGWCGRQGGPTVSQEISRFMGGVSGSMLDLVLDER